MTEETKEKVRTTYCEHCQKEVRVTIENAPSRSGQAVLQDHDEVVCLNFGEACDGEVCPLTHYRPVVMGVRLARSGRRPPEDWRTVRAQCEGCGQVSELEVVDMDHAYCTLCGTTNTWMILDVDREGRIVVTGRKEDE
jgi:Zn finger protein HypA/HybF involved in hydrogenase expression